MMKTSTIQLICGIALATMTTAGLSHWWSVRQFVSALNSGMPIPAAAPNPAWEPYEPAPAPSKAKFPVLATAAPTGKSAAPEPHQQEFYEALITKMENLQNQNRDLLDQVAETNRDIMKLEFRVDTHSEQFRPLPVNEERIDTSFDTSFDAEPGVLPPRAEPVMPPTHE
jgi:hypothetical protein